MPIAARRLSYWATVSLTLPYTGPFTLGAPTPTLDADPRSPAIDAVATPPMPATERARPARHRARGIASAIFAAATIVCLLLGNVALWMRQDVYSASNISREAQQIVGSADVQHAVADLLVTHVVRPALSQANLGSVLGPLAGVAERPVLSFASGLVDRAVASQPAQQIEARLIEAVTPQLEKGAGPVALSADQLVWIVSPSLAANRVVATVMGYADRSGCCAVVLAQRADLAFGWRHIRAIRAAGIVLPAATLVFAALALLVAPRRRRLVTVLAAATAVAGAATLVSLAAGPGLWINFVSRNSVAAGVVRAASVAVFHGATAGLSMRSWALVTAGATALVVLAGLRFVAPVRRVALAGEVA